MKVNPKFLSFYYENQPECADPVIDPKKTALLIIDLQKEFVSKEIGDALKLKAIGDWERWIPYYDYLQQVTVPNTKKMLDFFRANGMAVSFGRIACLREDGEDRSPVQKSDGWNGMLVHVDSEGAQMVDELTPIKNEIIVNKTTDSVVAGTNYARLLHFMGIEIVVVCGICTDQCVASTVRSLADEGFHVIVVEDCCACPSKELHDAELKIMSVIYCDVLSSEQTFGFIQKGIDEAKKA